MKKNQDILRICLGTLLVVASCSFTCLGGEMDDGESFFLQKDYKRAQGCYERALQLKLNDNNRALCLLMLGRCRFQQGDYAGAAVHFDRIEKELSDTDWIQDAKAARGDVFFKQGKNEEAAKKYEQAYSGTYIRRSGAHVLGKLARTYRKMGETKKAQEKESLILKEFPKSPEARILAKSAAAPKAAAVSSQASSKTASASGAGAAAKKYAVQVAFLPNEKGARDYVEKLRKQGYSKAYSMKRGKGYMVLVGNYASLSEVNRICTELKKNVSKDSYVIGV